MGLAQIVDNQEKLRRDLLRMHNEVFTSEDEFYEWNPDLVFSGLQMNCPLLFILSTIGAGFAVISAQAGINPLFTAFLTDRIFDQAEQ